MALIGFLRAATMTAAAVALAALISAPARAADSIIIKFSHVATPDTPKGRAAERFRELVTQRLGGKVKVEVYANSQLFKDKEELEALQLGAVQMLAPAISKFGPLGVREFEVFDLPFIFPTKESLRHVTEGPIGRDLMKKLESKGIVGLGYWDNGFRNMHANRPLRVPADFKGLKMRIVSSKVLEAQMRALGALPQVMAFSEVYQALQTGIVDGGESVPSNMYTQKMYEVQKYYSLTEHGYLGYAWIVNKKFWDDLPADVRTQLEQIAREVTAFNNESSQKDNDEALAAIKASGKTEILTLTAEQREQLRKAMLPIHDEMSKRVGRDLIDAIYKETGAK